MLVYEIPINENDPTYLRIIHSADVGIIYSNNEMKAK